MFSVCIYIYIYTYIYIYIYICTYTHDDIDIVVRDCGGPSNEGPPAAGYSIV